MIWICRDAGAECWAKAISIGLSFLARQRQRRYGNTFVKNSVKKTGGFSCLNVEQKLVRG
jgi:hypothetical protein